jgi:acyl-CoA thioesterase I
MLRQSGAPPRLIWEFGLMVHTRVIRAIAATGWLVVASMAIAMASLTVSARAEPLRIVAFGDSLSAGYELPPEEAFPNQLQSALKAQGRDVIVENAGVSGDTSTGGLERLDWSVADGTALVVLELGANDALRGIDPELTRANIDAMITRLKARGIGVVLAGMLAPPNMGATYADAFNAIFPDMAVKHGVALYPFFMEGVITKPELLLTDGIHPNGKGVARIVEGILPMVTALLDAAAQ